MEKHVQLDNLSALYQYLDDIVEGDVSNDELFASSYIRGFISLSASQFGDESQPLTTVLADDISNKITEARSELTPTDRAIVKDYWQNLQKLFNAK